MIERLSGLAIATLCCSLFYSPCEAGSIADAVRKQQDGKLRFSYPARPGVYGDGSTISIGRRPFEDDEDGWAPECTPCLVRVVLTLRDGEVWGLRSRVGGRWTSSPRGLTDLGEIPTADATQYLTTLAAEGNDNVACDALEAAVLADGVELWPQLLEFARDSSRSQKLRRSALFWLGQAAQDAVVAELGDLIEDHSEEIEIRKQAVFVLSQRHDEESLVRLMRIARDHRNAELRQAALFWLAQTDSPEIVDFFEEILRR